MSLLWFSKVGDEEIYKYLSSTFVAYLYIKYTRSRHTFDAFLYFFCTYNKKQGPPTLNNFLLSFHVVEFNMIKEVKNILRVTLILFPKESMNMHYLKPNSIYEGDHVH